MANPNTYTVYDETGNIIASGTAAECAGTLRMPSTRAFCNMARSDCPQYRGNPCAVYALEWADNFRKRWIAMQKKLGRG